MRDLEILRRVGLNPFYFRAAAELIADRHPAHNISLNPFYFRAAAERAVKTFTSPPDPVSIPFTSGLLLNPPPRENDTNTGLNPFYFRAAAELRRWRCWRRSRRSQSLLLQGCC